MITINLNKDFLGLDGKAVEGQDNLAKLLGNIMGNSTQGDALKYYAWALELYKTGILKVDDVDCDTIYNLIKDHATVSVILKGQILALIKEAKESNKEK